METNLHNQTSTVQDDAIKSKLKAQAGKILLRLADSLPDISMMLTRAALDKADSLVKANPDVLGDINFYLMESTNEWLKKKSPDDEAIDILEQFANEVKQPDVNNTFLNLAFNRIKRGDDGMWGWESDCRAAVELITICSIIYEWYDILLQQRSLEHSESTSNNKEVSLLKKEVNDLRQQLIKANSEVISLMKERLVDKDNN